MRAAFSFLKNLKKNNNRDWFQAHKEEYNLAKEEFESFIRTVIQKAGKYDPDIKALDAGKTIFRIYRDIRFSKDKTPYKTHFAASFQKDGKKTGYPGYYIHLEPGNSFVGGGIWQPDPEFTAKIRQEIDYCREEFLDIINNKNFQSHFGGLDMKDFSLKRMPKGYEADHPLGEFIKLNSWLANRAYSDEEVYSEDFLNKVVSDIKTLKPFMNFLNRALLP